MEIPLPLPSPLLSYQENFGGPLFYTERMKANPSLFKLRKWHFFYEGFLSSSILIIWTPVRELWSLSLRRYFDFILLWRILLEVAWPSGFGSCIHWKSCLAFWTWTKVQAVPAYSGWTHAGEYVELWMLTSLGLGLVCVRPLGPPKEGPAVLLHR